MNEIIGEKVDAKVKLQIIEWGAYNDQTNLMLSSGEKLDMVFLMSIFVKMDREDSSIQSMI